MLIAVLLLPGTVEAQANHFVTVSPNGVWGDGPHFFPSHATISTGDTVVWRSRYNDGVHDITWPAGEFPPSSVLPVYLTFNRAGEFGYRCTVHGRSGSITVEGETTPTPPFQINAGLNDAWMDPATPGQGFFISVFPEIEKMFVAWFTYDTTRPPGSVRANLGDPGHRWLTALGTYHGNQAVLEIEVTQGGIFDAASPEPAQHGDGTLIVEMSDCESGTIRYDIVSANLEGEIPIKRIALDNVPLCEALAEQLQQSR